MRWFQLVRQESVGFRTELSEPAGRTPPDHLREPGDQECEAEPLAHFFMDDQSSDGRDEAESPINAHLEQLALTCHPERSRGTWVGGAAGM